MTSTALCYGFCYGYFALKFTPMITRRTILFGMAGAAFASLLTGCRQAENALKIILLEGAIPSEVLQTFRKQAENPVSFQLVSQIASVFQQLQVWQQPPETSGFSIKRFLPWADAEKVPKPDDLVSLGDYWLRSAIAQNLIAPLSIPPASLDKLPTTWQQFVSRNAQGEITGEIAPQSSLWAAPYKVQTLVIVYRQSEFSESSASNPPFKSWRDLLLPELRQSLALPDHPRLVIGLAQKIQNGSFNPILEGSTEKPDSALVDTLTQLNQQVKTYDSDNSLKALVNEDVKAVVGWSGDAVAAAKRYRDLRIIVPPEGSLLSVDMWVRPRSPSSSLNSGPSDGPDSSLEMSPAAQRWIDFCWQPDAAAQISLSGQGLSPIFLSADVSLPKTLSESFPYIEATKKSEPLLPIPEKLQAAYFELWKQLRSA